MASTASSTSTVNWLGGNDVLTVDNLAGTKVRGGRGHDEAAVLGGTAPDAGNDQTIVNGRNIGRQHRRRDGRRERGLGLRARRDGGHRARRT